MKKLLLLTLLAFFAVNTAGEVQYSIEADKEKVSMNTSIELQCDERCPISQWQLTWSIPENSEVLSVRDSQGSIDDYEVKGDKLSITTNSGPPRENETIKVWLEKDEDAEEVHDGLYRRTFSIPSFQGERTTGFVETEEMVSGWIGYGFESSFTENEMRFRGSGPTNVRINFGEGQETEYYSFFGKSPQGDEDQNYRISLGTIQSVPNFKRFPVTVMGEESYNGSVNSWSAGEYVSGSIRLRDDLGDNYHPILAHETVHGLNDRKLKWDDTSSTYFDEGTAEYTEYLVKKKLYRNDEIDVGPQEVFGGEKRYDGEGRKYYTVSSHGDREKLWNYYQQDSEMMKAWNPNDYPEWREFGYAYSKLLIMNHVANNRSLQEVYENMEFSSRVKDRDEKWNFYSQNMDMTPCKYESRERFDNCLDRINNYDYKVYSAEPVFSDEQLELEEVQVPNRSKTSYGSVPKSIRENVTDASIDMQGFLSGFADYVISLIQDLVSSL